MQPAAWPASLHRSAGRTSLGRAAAGYSGVAVCSTCAACPACPGFSCAPCPSLLPNATPPASSRCDRLDSHVLNERPDEGDEKAWRHGTFKPQQEAVAQHLAAAQGVAFAAC
jgi:hypothetical protein